MYCSDVQYCQCRDDSICAKATVIIHKLLYSCEITDLSVGRDIRTLHLGCYLYICFNFMKDDADCGEIKGRHCTASSCCPFDNLFKEVDDQQLCGDTGDNVACCKSLENCNWKDDASRGEKPGLIVTTTNFNTNIDDVIQ